MFRHSVALLSKGAEHPDICSTNCISKLRCIAPKYKIIFHVLLIKEGGMLHTPHIINKIMLIINMVTDSIGRF